MRFFFFTHLSRVDFLVRLRILGRDFGLQRFAGVECGILEGDMSELGMKVYYDLV